MLLAVHAPVSSAGIAPAHIEAFKVEGPLKKDIDVGTAGFPTAGGTIPVVGGTGAFAGARGMVAFAAGTVADQDGFVLSIDITTG